MLKIMDSYSYVRRNIGKIAYKVIRDWYEANRFVPIYFQFPL